MTSSELAKLMSKLTSQSSEEGNESKEEIEEEDNDEEDSEEEEQKIKVGPTKERNPFPELKLKEEVTEELEDAKEDSDNKEYIVPSVDNVENEETKTVNEHHLTFEQQIELLQNDGRFRLEFLSRLDQINTALTIIAKVVGGLDGNKN